jgi:hypothetical protein
MDKLDKKTFLMGVLILSAAILAVGHLLVPQTPAIAATAVQNRDYQLVTAKIQSGGEALYVSDNRTGMVAVFQYNPTTRTVEPKKMRPLAEALGGR